MTIEEAIKKARDEGFSDRFGWDENLVLMQPSLWQSLGIALGWKYADGTDVTKYFNNDPKRTAYPLNLWQWHRFIDHLAKGKPADSFFRGSLVTSLFTAMQREVKYTTSTDGTLNRH